MNKILLPVLLCLLVDVTSALAQENVVLPDLAPREVEITGDLAIAFPSLRRQPLIGFNPPPRVPEIPDSRRPYTEPYKQPSADLPPSPLSAPAPPDVTALASRAPANGSLTALAGTYLDRSIDLDVSRGLSASSAFTFSFDYFGTNGHDGTPTGESTARDLLSASAQLNKKAGAGWFSMHVDGVRNAWSLFSAVPTAGGPGLANPERSLMSLGTSASWTTVPGARVAAHFGARWQHETVSTDLFDPAIRSDPSTERTDARVNMDGTVRLPVGSNAIALSASGTQSGLDSGGAFSFGSIRSGRADVVWQTPRDRVMTIDAGAAVLGFESTAENRNVSYLAPVLQVAYWFREGWSVFAGTSPEIDAPSLGELFTASPYLQDEPLQWSSLSQMDAHAGIGFRGAVLEGVVRTGLKEYASFGYESPVISATSGYSSGLFARSYGEATSMYVHADVSLALSTTFQAGSVMRLQHVELSSTKDAAPLISPLSARAWLTMSAFDADLQTTFSADYESPRRIRTDTAVKTRSLLRAELSSAYSVGSSYAIVLRLRHLVSEPEFWPGYPLEGTSVNAGLRWRW